MVVVRVVRSVAFVRLVELEVNGRRMREKREFEKRESFKKERV